MACVAVARGMASEKSCRRMTPSRPGEETRRSYKENKQAALMGRSQMDIAPYMQSLFFTELPFRRSGLFLIDGR